VVLARELTKKFEQFLRGSAAELLAVVRQRTLKGEFVVVIAATSFGGVSFTPGFSQVIGDYE
jgi:16S rRNA (cytidine1402-2'-O)-methyltransferase